MQNLITSIIPSYGTSSTETAPSTLYPPFDTCQTDSSRKFNWRLFFKVLLLVLGAGAAVLVFTFFFYVWFTRYNNSHVDEMESAQQFFGQLPIQNNPPPF